MDHAVPSGPLHEMLWYGKYRFKGDEEATKGEFPGHLKALTGKRKRGWGGASQVWVREAEGSGAYLGNGRFSQGNWGSLLKPGSDLSSELRIALLL